MSLKPVTFQGAENFKANLYALEVRSRFVDQGKADGYYAGYGNELSATVASNTIKIGSGAFVVQGRMCEVENSESVSVVNYCTYRNKTYNEWCKLFYHSAHGCEQRRIKSGFNARKHVSIFVRNNKQSLRTPTLLFFDVKRRNYARRKRNYSN